MNDQYKALTVELANEMNKLTYQFLFDRLSESPDENTSDIINLILSANLSSAFTGMRTLASEHEPMLKEVDRFIDQVTKFIADMKVISGIEVL